jgi:hypothetical protein
MPKFFTLVGFFSKICGQVHTAAAAAAASKQSNQTELS